MESLFDRSCAERIKQRLSRLTPDQHRQWGSMDVVRMLTHCSRGLEMAAGEIHPPRAMMGRILGPILKPIAFREGEPMRKNSPTARELLTDEAADFETALTRLNALVDRFVAAGPAGCTSHPHPFFGSLDPREWSMLMYKHLDHHLRQFGA